MKPWTTSLIGMALLLNSCYSAIDEEFLSEEVLVPIRFALKADTRAPISGITSSNLSSVGIYGAVEGSTTGQYPWTGTPFVSNLVPSSISGNLLSFTTPLFYPAGGKRVKFYGYYPRTTSTTGSPSITPPGVGTAPIYKFTINGQDDIMQAASTPSGSTSPATVALMFNHKLTQIQLTNISLLGALLSGIKLKDVKSSGSMNIETGVITYGTTLIDIPFTVSGGSTLPLLVPAEVASYVVEVALLGLLLPQKYLIKPTAGNFQAGVLYQLSLK